MRILRATMVVSAMFLVALPLTAHAWDRGEVQRFATLPAGQAHPEGLTVDRDGNVYVTTFDVSKTSGPRTTR